MVTKVEWRDILRYQEDEEQRRGDEEWAVEDREHHPSLHPLRSPCSLFHWGSSPSSRLPAGHREAIWHLDLWADSGAVCLPTCVTLVSLWSCSVVTPSVFVCVWERDGECDSGLATAKTMAQQSLVLVFFLFVFFLSFSLGKTTRPISYQPPTPKNITSGLSALLFRASVSTT